jgi:hypothetical protein
VQIALIHDGPCPFQSTASLALTDQLHILIVKGPGYMYDGFAPDAFDGMQAWFILEWVGCLLFSDSKIT